MMAHTQTPVSFGWTGTILHVNLSDGAVTRLPTPAYSNKYLGGRGIATRLYWEMVSPDTDALAPDNPLIS